MRRLKGMALHGAFASLSDEKAEWNRG